MTDSDGLVEEFDEEIEARRNPAIALPRAGWVRIAKLSISGIVLVGGLGVSTHVINTYLAAALGPDRSPPPLFSGAAVVDSAKAVLAKLGELPALAGQSATLAATGDRTQETTVGEAIESLDVPAGLATGMAAKLSDATTHPADIPAPGAPTSAPAVDTALPAEASEPDAGEPFALASQNLSDQDGIAAMETEIDALDDDPRLAGNLAAMEIAALPDAPLAESEAVPGPATASEVWAIAASLRPGELMLPEALVAADNAAAVDPVATPDANQSPHGPQTAAVAPSTGETMPTWRVQLIALRDRSSAQLASVSFQQANPDLLEDLTLHIERANLPHGTFYRVQAGPLADRAEAKELCSALKARNQDCLVVAP